VLRWPRWASLSLRFVSVVLGFVGFSAAAGSGLSPAGALLVCSTAGAVSVFAWVLRCLSSVLSCPLSCLVCLYRAAVSEDTGFPHAAWRRLGGLLGLPKRGWGGYSPGKGACVLLCA